MLLAHIADVHIGVGRKWKEDLTSESPFYLQRHRMYLESILDSLKKNPVDGIILAGDLLDSSKPTAKEYELLAWWLYQLVELGPVHIIAGNHEDIHGGLTSLHPAQAFMAGVENIFWHLDTAEIAQEKWGSTLWASHHQTSKIQEMLGQKPEYVVAHYAAKGSVYDSGLEATKGWEIQYPGCKQVFIGDIHVRQSVAHNAHYCGSPCQLNFGESGSKGFDIYDTEAGKRSQVILNGGIPLLTVRIKDAKPPEFNPKALYKVLASREYLDYKYPENVVTVQLLETKNTKETAEQLVNKGEIDFGDPLGGIEKVLTRAKLIPSLIESAKETAKTIAIKYQGV